MSEAYERERYTHPPSSPLHQSTPPNPPILTQTKQRLPLRPLQQSLRAAQRDGGHLRPGARPERHRLDFRNLLLHDHRPEEQCAEAGRHGEAGGSRGRVEGRGHYYCCRCGFVVVAELDILRECMFFLVRWGGARKGGGGVLSMALVEFVCSLKWSRRVLRSSCTDR